MKITKEAATAFLEDLADVCKKHGLSISHEDEHGAFLVTEFDKSALEWLCSAVRQDFDGRRPSKGREKYPELYEEVSPGVWKYCPDRKVKDHK